MKYIVLSDSDDGPPAKRAPLRLSPAPTRSNGRSTIAEKLDDGNGYDKRKGRGPAKKTAHEFAYLSDTGDEKDGFKDLEEFLLNPTPKPPPKPKPLTTANSYNAPKPATSYKPPLSPTPPLPSKRKTPTYTSLLSPSPPPANNPLPARSAASNPTTLQPAKKQKTSHILLPSDLLDLALDSDSDHYPKHYLSPNSASGNDHLKGLSASTVALIAELAEQSDDSPPKIKKPTVGKLKRAPDAASKRREKTTRIDGTASEESQVVHSKPKKASRISEEEKARRAAEKAAKAAEKEAAKMQKLLEKEAKEAERKKERELLSVNKLKSSKKESAPEMIVDVARTFSSTPLGEQVQAFLKGAWGCEVTAHWTPSLGEEGDWRLVKWRRKVRAEYDEAREIFVPLPSGEEIRDEGFLLVHLTAKEFVDLAVDRTFGGGIDGHVKKLKSLFSSRREGIRCIYMIEGLAALLRKGRNQRNRNFQSQVRAAMGEGGATSRRSGDVIDEEKTEDALLRLQVMHDCLIYQTGTEVESAEWISIFTGDISSIPYKNSRMAMDTSFCADVGQVKTGSGREDTYIKMLQGIHRVTVSVANGIASEYPDVMSLVKGFRKDGAKALEAVPIMATRNGAPSNRTIGIAGSKRIHGIFMSQDIWSTDV